MRFYLLAIAAIIFAAGVSADPDIDRIFRDLKRGEINRAQAEFRQLPQTTVRDGNRLFLSALFESTAERSGDLLEAAIRSNLDGKYEEEARFRLIQLAEAGGDTATVLEAGAAFLDRWEMSDYREQILAILGAHSPEGSLEQTRYFDLLIDGFPGSYFGQYARLVKAGAAFERKHYKTATTLCRRINNSPDENLTPASLILLSRIALNKGESERALLNYNILREQYRYAIGEEELLSALKIVSEEKSGRESVEIFEGISYSVQVGVFANKDNANGMSDRVKAYGYRGIIKRRTISGNQYHVVLAGRFKTMKEAEAARQKLEMGENQVFKVVVNDEK
jgi:hypothetical protein